MSRKGDCWDNAVAESFFATLKRELEGIEAMESRAAATISIGDYIVATGLEGYHFHRDHRSPGPVRWGCRGRSPLPQRVGWG
jgi:putative transposase